MAKFLKMLKDDGGATAIEYGLIAALIAVAAIAAMGEVGTKLNSRPAGPREARIARCRRPSACQPLRLRISL